MACDSGCQQEKEAIRKAINQLVEYRSRMIEQLKRDRPAEVHELLNPRQLRGSFQNVVVIYFDFPVWLYRFDQKLIYGLQVNINSYRYQRDRHIDEVSTELAKLLSKETGRALRDAIGDAGHELKILPYFNFAIYPQLPWLPLGLNSTAGSTADLENVGADSVIHFSPHMWSHDGKPGSAGFNGPGSAVDEVLFHEMIHGLRHMKGVNVEHVNVDDNYDNEEEFIAVVLSNIYLAEKKLHKLRGGHDGFNEMMRPNDFSKNPRYMQLLRNFKAKQRAFYHALAHISEDKAWWNPVRDLWDAEG